MAKQDELQVCGIDGCAELASAQAAAANLEAASELSIVSDAICPWCYVGKRRLEKALAMLGDAPPLRITWRPFELNPQMPKEGIERRLYRMRKFGSWERSLALDAQLTEVGKSEGLSFRYDLIQCTPNTFDAHRLIWYAGNEGRQDAMVETLFRGYFSEGRDIGNADVLAELASEAGLSKEDAAKFLRGSGGSVEVRTDEEIAQRAGLSGVPTFILNGIVLFSGAQPSNLIAQVLQQQTMTRAPA